MKVTRNIFATLFVTTALSCALASCGKDDGKKPVNPVDPTPTETILRAGKISGNVVIKKNSKCILDGSVFVPQGATLTIEEGVTIEAKEGFNNYILVEKGGKIFVKGTATHPVIMTSVSKKPGAWGGLIINGKSHINEGSTTQTEINAEIPYGVPGDQNFDPNDNSGSVEYLILEYTGASVNANIEHNGLTLDAVGAGTKIENVFVYKSSDDGIEFFGGNVTVSNLLCVDNDDDMFDFTQGYRGTLRNAYGIWNKGHQSTEEDPRGVEADGNHDGKKPEAKTQSDFTIDGLTIALFDDMNAGPEYIAKKGVQAVLKIRRGCSINVKNFKLIGSGKSSCIIDTTDSKGDAKNVTVSLDKSGYTGTTGANKVKSANLKVNETTNAGTPQSAFAWTGYDFRANTYHSKAK